jgi:hypothetical protein
MSKSDFPALRMTIDGGRLVPAGPFDAERLNSYRRGTIVYVRFTEEKDRVLIRKWFAVLGLVLKQCQTPWKNKDEAHEAIKLALGIVNLSKTVHGQFMQYPKSLAELEDPELQEALDQMIDLLSAMTGVDVATLKKETAHIVDHDEQTGEIIEHETTEPGSPSPEPDADASLSASAEGVDMPPSTPSSIPDATEQPVADLASGEDPAGGEQAPTQPPAGSTLSSDQRAKLIEAAGKFMKLAMEPISFESRLAFLESREADWRDVIEPANWPKLESLATAARAVINSKRTAAQAIEFMASVLECPTSAIGG